MKTIHVLVLVMSAAACSGTDATVTPAPSGSAPAAPGSPAAPSSLTGEPMGTGIHLVWKDNASNEDGYDVERKDGSSAFAKIYSVPFDTFSYHDASLAAGKAYSYRVRAVNAKGASAYSNEITATAPSGATPGGGGGGPADAGSIDASAPNPTFQRDIVPLLQVSCGAGNSTCHIRDMYAATKDRSCRGWLSLEDALIGSKIYGGPSGGQPTGCPDLSLYDRLTQLDAWEEPGGRPRRYVKPGDPANSYLYNKLTNGPFGEKAPGVLSDPMPTAAPLPPEQVALVKRWIEQGAPK